MRLESVRIVVDDLAKAASFYEEVVGLTRAATAPTAVLVEPQDGGGIPLLAHDPSDNTISFVQYPAAGTSIGGQ